VMAKFETDKGKQSDAASSRPLLDMRRPGQTPVAAIQPAR
jgi:hypothetical protein